VEALAGVLALGDSVPANLARPSVRRAMTQGAVWLVEQVESGAWREPSPIGFYFAKLWYFERLYPLIFTVGALGKVAAAAGTIQDQREVTK
jgi:squalene-hopene/tetraprenyl-beta-curcumene cyclase